MASFYKPILFFLSIWIRIWGPNVCVDFCGCWYICVCTGIYALMCIKALVVADYFLLWTRVAGPTSPRYPAASSYSIGIPVMHHMSQSFMCLWGWTSGPHACACSVSPSFLKFPAGFFWGFFPLSHNLSSTFSILHFWFFT